MPQRDLETDGIRSLHNLQLPYPGAPHDERPRLFMVGGTDKAFSTLQEAVNFAKGGDTQ
jgi:hypothetical protein